MLKVNTDTIVNLPLLYNQLTDDKKNINSLLMGQLKRNKAYLHRNYHGNGHHFTQDVHRKKGKKPMQIQFEEKSVEYSGNMPNYMYNGNEYPSYLSGDSGYVVSRSSAECIFEKALKTSYFPLEDVFITGFLAQACGIIRVNNPGFSDTPRPFNKQKDLVIHHACKTDANCYAKLQAFNIKHAN